MKSKIMLMTLAVAMSTSPYLLAQATGTASQNAMHSDKGGDHMSGHDKMSQDKMNDKNSQHNMDRSDSMSKDKSHKKSKKSDSMSSGTH